MGLGPEGAGPGFDPVWGSGFVLGTGLVDRTLVGVGPVGDKGGAPEAEGSGRGHGRDYGRSLDGTFLVCPFVGSEGHEDRWQIALTFSCVWRIGIHWREVASLVLIGLLMLAKHPGLQEITS